MEVISQKQTKADVKLGRLVVDLKYALIDLSTGHQQNRESVDEIPTFGRPYGTIWLAVQPRNGAKVMRQRPSRAMTACRNLDCQDRIRDGYGMRAQPCFSQVSGRTGVPV